MKRFSAVRVGRTGKIGLALGAATIAGLTILGGAATANAASTTPPSSDSQEAVLETGPGPDMTGVPICDVEYLSGGTLQMPDGDTADVPSGPSEDAVLETGPGPDMTGVPICDVTLDSDSSTPAHN